MGFMGFLSPTFETVTPLIWTYLAAATELAAPVLLALGVLARPSALALATMGLAVAFHVDESGGEGLSFFFFFSRFPFAVVEAHQYQFEAAALYCAIFLFFLFKGPGKLSVSGGK